LLIERENSIKRLIAIEQKLNSSVLSRDNTMWDETEEGQSRYSDSEELSVDRSRALARASV